MATRHTTLVPLLSTFLLGFGSMGCAHAQAEILVTFEDHGEKKECSSWSIDLLLDGRALTTRYTKRGFVVPEEVQTLTESREAEGKLVEVSIACGTERLDSPEVYASWFRSGHWRVGVDYPPFRHFTHYGMPKHGAWVSYLSYECHGCIGAEMWVSHQSPLAGMEDALLEEQPSAKGARASEIAYALAVFNRNYDSNRNLLLGRLRGCVDIGNRTWESEVCDYQLLDFVTNLYWRGDHALLNPLLNLAEESNRFLSGVGVFYADILDQQAEVTLKAMEAVHPERQALICEIAWEGDLSTDRRKRERVVQALGQARSETAQRCLTAMERVASTAP